jgi:hypothetical protein
LVLAASNLEYFKTDVGVVMMHVDFHHLSPLSKTLKNIQICYDGQPQQEMEVDIDLLIELFPSLQAWYFGELESSPYQLGHQPSVHNLSQLDPIEVGRASPHIQTKETKYIYADRVEHWFVGLKEEDRYRPEIIELVIQHRYCLPYVGFCNLVSLSNSIISGDKKNSRKEILRKFELHKEAVGNRRKLTRTFWGGVTYWYVRKQR